MGYNIGPTIAVKGDKEYASALKGIKDSMRLVASEAAVMTAEFGKNSTSTAALKAKSETLNKAMSEQQKAVSAAEQALKRMDEAGVKPTDAAYVQMKTNLNNAKAALAATKNELDENSQALKKGGKATSDFGEKWGELAKVAGTVAIGALKGIGIAAGAVAAAIGALAVKFAEGIKDVAAFGDNVDKNSQRLGLSREAYQEWEFVLSQSGVDINTMQVGLKTLTNTIDDAKNGVTGATEKFSRLGISMDDVSTLSREEIFAKTIAGLQDMTDETAKAALANDLFGRSGQEILPLLNQTAESTEALRKKAIDYGFVMSDAAITASVNFTDSLDLLSHTATGLKNNLMAEFLPSVTTAMDGLSLLLTGDTSGIEQIQEGIQEFISTLSELLPEITSAGGAIIQQLITSMLENLPAFVSEALPPMIESVSEMITMLLETVIAILPETLPAIVGAASNVMNALLVSLQQNIGPISQAVVQIVAMLAAFLLQNLPLIIQTGLQIIVALTQGIAESLPELIPAVVDMVVQIATTLTDPETLSALVVAALEIVIALAQGLIEAIPDLLAAAAQIVVNLAIAFANAAPQLWEEGKGFIVQLGEGISAQFSELFLTVGTWVNDNVLQPVKDKVSDFFSVGKDLITGIWNGIENKIEWLKSKVKGLVDIIKGWFTGKDGFDNNSPSKWGIRMGITIPQGIGIGLDKGLGEALSSASHVISRIKGTLSDTGGNMDASSGSASSAKAGSTAPQYVFHIYAKDKETAVEAADATYAAFARSRWAVST